MELQVNEREALLIVTALGTYQNRVGQHTSWDQRKRLTTLRGRLADCVIIGDEEEAKGIHKALPRHTDALSAALPWAKKSAHCVRE